MCDVRNQNKKFIVEKNFHTSNTAPTNSFHNQIRKTINNSKIFIPQNSQWKYIKLNPSALTTKGLMKIHKPNQPICPIVNWRNAPAYKSTTVYTHDHPVNFAINVFNTF